ncbi:MAG: putative toxin-antitoxin system toxin component, PIN family [Deltaproteobacteria bacterium RBG_16_49_23]|nr:MAG: putative toxin-antitoxin system toxin component, PIN family [Deltaproteobacteria bacterium RBG_16_49_23]
MKVVLDTNVLVSGVFFGGPPHKILEAWRDGKFQLIISPAILEEYQRVMRDLAAQFPEIEVEALLDFLIVHSEIVLPPLLPPVIQLDPSDDKFLECAVAGKAACIVTGDKHLMKLLKFRGISILKPREFVQAYLSVTAER